MAAIKELQNDENGWFANGKFMSTSLFQGNIDVCVFIDDGATVEYAEKCIEHYNRLNQNEELLLKLDTYLEKFFLYMYEEWKAMGIFSDIVKRLEPILEAYKSGQKLITFLSEPTLFVYPPQDGIGYGIACNCPWEPEHQCLILMRNDSLLYVGQADALDAWEDEDAYHCVWQD